MRATDAQVRKLMEELSKSGKIGRAAMKAGLDRKTARKYIREGKLPSEMPVAQPRRTRVDPFESDWPDLARRLADAPELEAKTLFEWLQEDKPDRYDLGQLRTLQRHRATPQGATLLPPRHSQDRNSHLP